MTTKEKYSIISKQSDEKRFKEKMPIEITKKKESPAMQVVRILKERNMHISFAESCTGGLCTAEIVSIPDASYVLDASVVTYANSAKIKYLGVSPDTIEKYGVVSEEVAAEMARGAAENNCADVGVGITGIAGPGGATEKKPVGMVSFGFYINGSTKTYTKQFGSIGRNSVRAASVDFVFEKLTELLI